MTRDVRVLSDSGGLDPLAREWAALWDECPDASPFVSPEWLVPWWRHFPQRKLRVVCVREHGRLAGLLALFGGEADGQRQLAPLGAGISDDLGPLLHPTSSDLAPALLQAALDDETPSCRLERLRPESPWLRVRCAGLAIAVGADEVAPALRLPHSAEQFWTSRPARSRANFRQSWARLERDGGVSVEQATAGTLPAALDALFDLHAAAWQARGSGGVLSGPGLRAFHDEAAAALQRSGRLRLLVLRHRGRPAAVLYGLSARGRFAYYLGGYDPGLSRYSPGSLLVGLAIEQAIGEGCHTFDFLTGREAYKYAWGAEDAPLFRLEARRDARS